MNNKPLISPLHRVVITKFLEQYKQSINFINEIKKDIPLPHLQCNLNKFNKGKRLEIK